MILELVDDLVNFKGRQDSFYQHRGFDSAAGNIEHRLGAHENIVPEARLGVAFELGQIKVGAASSLDEIFHVMKEKKPEIEDGARNGSAVHLDVFFE